MADIVNLNDRLKAQREEDAKYAARMELTAGGLGASLLRDPTLVRIGAAHGCSAAAVALAWTIRSGNVIAIPESGSVAHVKENAVALSLTLTPQELQSLDAAYPLPNR
jgi:diketogulonate reductase-like aldo/keto reductase